MERVQFLRLQVKRMPNPLTPRLSRLRAPALAAVTIRRREEVPVTRTKLPAGVLPEPAMAQGKHPALEWEAQALATDVERQEREQGNRVTGLALDQAQAVARDREHSPASLSKAKKVAV